MKKNTIANFIGQIYSIIIGLIMLPFYLKHLGSESYGLIGFFTMLQYWIAMLDLGLSGTLAREAARLNNKLRELQNIIKSIELFYYMMGAVIVTIIYFFSEWIVTKWLNIEELRLSTVVISIQLMGLMIAIKLNISLYRGIIIGFENQVWLNIYNIIFNSFRFIGAFLIIYFITTDILYFFLYQTVVVLVEYIVIVQKVKGYFSKFGDAIYSFNSLKNIIHFALSLGISTMLWIAFSQFDKLFLSHLVTLTEYGYYSLVIVIISALMNLVAPIGQAVLPRMVALYANNNIEKMFDLYYILTKIISILMFSVVGIISYYAFELLFVWTGNHEAAQWGAPILRWYAIGSAFASLIQLLYFLQYAHGNLKYHLRFHLIIPFIGISTMYFVLTTYGPIAIGFFWFTYNILIFIFWSYFIHKK
ncbi:oligosaccharide flippase family protein, partial [Sulfurimonas sp. SAG-AH-194-C21]